MKQKGKLVRVNVSNGGGGGVFRDQDVDNNYIGFDRIIWDCRLINNDRGVGRGLGIDDMSEGSETMTEAARA